MPSLLAVVLISVWLYGIRQKVPHQAGRVFQGAVLQMGITLRQGGILVRQQLLHMGKRHAIGNGHTGKGMPQSVQGTEIRRKIGGFFTDPPNFY